MPQHLAEQAETEQLNARHDQQDREIKQWTGADIADPEMFFSQVDTKNDAEPSQNDTHGAKKMQRLLHIAGQEQNLEEIKQALGKTPGAEFRLAVYTRVVLHRNLGHAKTFPGRE